MEFLRKLHKSASAAWEAEVVMRRALRSKSIHVEFSRSNYKPEERSESPRRHFALQVFIWSIAFLAGVAPAASQTAAVSPQTDPGNGYPVWYQDKQGVRLQPCLYGANGLPDPFCVLLADAGFKPASPLVFPSNWPVEFFYFVADSDKLTTPGCGSVTPGTAKWRGALEGSFLTGIAQPGQQSTFTRTKIVATGLCPNTTYNFTHPYGVDAYKTDSSGQIVANKKGGTIDIGCLAAPCDFSLALSSRVMDGFLRWDPASGAPPAGYLGDAATLHSITGSPGTNVFSIALGTAAAFASTTQFTVSGKIAGPLTASPASLDFGGQAQSTTGVVIPIAITNLFSSPITPSTALVNGQNAGDFAISSNNCSGVSLARDQSCVISMTFTPAALGFRSATLAVSHDGPSGSPLNVALTGTGTTQSAAPVVLLSATSFDLGSARVRTVSGVQTLTVSNTGTAPLSAVVAIVNADPNTFSPAADQFVKVTDSCTGVFVAAGSSCSVGVQFAPTIATANPVTALLSLTDNAANSPQTVTLTGKGTGGLAAVSSSKTAYGYPDWYQDENAVQVQPCLNPAQPCVLIKDPGYDPAQPLALPGNFPIEFFYFVADSDKMDLPGCPATGFGGAKVTFRAALEGSFVTTALDGQQIAFTRTKIVVPPGGLCPNRTYAFTHPYGTDQVTTDASGGVVANKKGATIDVGCLGAPCDFSLPLSSRVMGGILKWDPTVSPLAPIGFIGDASAAAGTPHAIVGSPFLDPVSGTPANFLRISDPQTGAVLNGCKDANGVVKSCRVDLFTVSGKLASPITASPDKLNFGAETISIPSAPKTVTLTNTGLTPQILSATITGPNASEFTIPNGADLCGAITLQAGNNCTIGVTANPGATGSRVAALSVAYNGLQSPAQVPLSVFGNQPPVAKDDTTNTVLGSAVNINVLANDTDPDGNLPLTAKIATSPGNGTAAVQTNNTITYTPNSGFSGTDTFTYQAIDSLGGVSAPATVTVNIANIVATTTSINSPAITWPTDGFVTVTVSSTGGTPTGNVSLTIDGATTINSPLVSGVASFTVKNPNAGNHTLSASYAAQGNFAASGPATGTLLVNQAATTTKVTAPAITWGANGSVTVTVASTGGTPSGNVSLSIDGATAILQPLNAAGTTTFAVLSPAVGLHTLAASYAGLGNFAPSSNGATLTVNPVFAETITATATANVAANFGSASWSITGTTSALTPTHTMTVRLTRTLAQIGSATTDKNGKWTLSVNKSIVVPLTGDTITVSSASGIVKTFPVIVK
jgi:hypothetical protein